METWESIELISSEGSIFGVYTYINTRENKVIGPETKNTSKQTASMKILSANLNVLLVTGREDAMTPIRSILSNKAPVIECAR